MHSRADSFKKHVVQYSSNVIDAFSLHIPFSKKKKGRNILGRKW
jgi:hypothetical protein